MQLEKCTSKIKLLQSLKCNPSILQPTNFTSLKAVVLRLAVLKLQSLKVHSEKLMPDKFVWVKLQLLNVHCSYSPGGKLITV